MRKFPIYETVLLLIILLLAGLSGCRPPQKTPIGKVPNEDYVATRVDSFYIEGNGFAEYEFGNYTPTGIMTVKPDTIIPYRVQCPPCTTIVTKRFKNKVKDSYNYIGEINKLVKSNQVKDSQIDSLVMLTGKKPVGQQTNNGAKWYLWLLIGMALGVTSYQGIRSAITKKW